MNWYEVQITPLAPFRTPWRNDTIWGRLTWAVAQEAIASWNIHRWLQAYRDGNPPLVVADGFPRTGFPLPAAWHTLPTKDDHKPPEVITFEELTRLSKGNGHPIESGQPLRPSSRLHVSLSRSTGCAVDGSLYVADAYLPPEDVPISVVTLLDHGLTPRDLEALWQHVASEGWGKGRSTGYGAFRLDGVTPLEPPAQDANGFVTLGHIIPNDDLPLDGLWRWSGIKTVPHDPDTGLTMFPPLFSVALRPGACFREKPPRQWTGRMLLHPLEGHPNYTRYGLAPAWPITWPD
ncbi:MAG: hypothetical protein AMXMBFR61_08400 [Fimbriimonadales bacterium]